VRGGVFVSSDEKLLVEAADWYITANTVHVTFYLEDCRAPFRVAPLRGKTISEVVAVRIPAAIQAAFFGIWEVFPPRYISSEEVAALGVLEGLVAAGFPLRSVSSWGDSAF